MKKLPYQTPTIETLTSSEVVETLGPVQGYGGGAPSLAGGKGVGGAVATGGSILDISRN
jgi:hypothetical protein